MANSYLPENPPPYSKTSTTSIEVENTAAEEEVQQNLLNSAIAGEKSADEKSGKGGDQQNQAQQKSTAADRIRSCCGIDIGNRRGKVRLLLQIISLLVLILGLIQLLYLHLYLKPRNLKLLAAVEQNDLDTVQQMLESDATLNVNARFPEYQGRAALHLAAQHGFVDMARLLLAHRANATLRTSGPHWQSPLHAAANSACRAPMVKLLLDAGATPEDKDGAGRQAIDYEGTSPECKSAMYERSYRKRWAEDWARKTARVQALQKSIGEGGFLANGGRWKSHMKDMLGILAPEMYGKKGEEEEVV